VFVFLAVVVAIAGRSTLTVVTITVLHRTACMLGAASASLLLLLSFCSLSVLNRILGKFVQHTLASASGRTSVQAGTIISCTQGRSTSTLASHLSLWILSVINFFSCTRPGSLAPGQNHHKYDFFQAMHTQHVTTQAVMCIVFVAI